MIESPRINSRSATAGECNPRVSNSFCAAKPEIMLGWVFGARCCSGDCALAWAIIAAVLLEIVERGKKAKTFPPTVVYGPRWYQYKSESNLDLLV